MKNGVLTLLLLCVCALVEAATIHVPDSHPTVQDAIDAALAGDTIVVRPGTYTERIDFAGKAILVRSEAGPAVTVLDGCQGGSVVTFGSGEGSGSVLEGFTVTNGTGTDVGGRDSGGGILCGPAASPVIRGCVIRDNSCWDGGGIHVFDSSSPLISDNRITGNACKNGGAINITGDSTPTVTGNVLTANKGSIYAGAIRCDRNCDALIEDNVISDNVANSGRGGAIYAFAATPVIRGNVFTGNEALKCGGAIYIKSCSPVIEGNLIFGNRTTADYGGGIQVSTRSRPAIAGNTITGNFAQLGGGGINVFHESEPMITNTVVAGNTTDFVGAGINCVDLSAPSLANCTIVANTALGTGGGLTFYNGTTGVAVNLIVWGNSASSGDEVNRDGSSSASVTFSDVRGGWNGAGNIDASPLFVDGAGGDYHLTRTSPCFNAGFDLPGGDPTDIEGDPRIALGATDMGADEFHSRLYTMSGAKPGGTIAVSVVGRPGSAVTLFYGAGVQSPPGATPHGDLHILWPPLWQGKIGSLSANGVLTYSFAVPSGWVSGEEKPLQALIGQWGNARTQFTNLLLLRVE